MYRFSAKDLCTRSCMQIKMFNEHPEKRPQPSEMVNYGEKFQNAVADTIPNIIGQEMRGTFRDFSKDVAIDFSNDIVCKNKIIEVKSVSHPFQDWYFNSSLLQCAFYKSMIMLGANNLETASFYTQLGNEKIYTKVDNGIRYVLIFGEDKYEIMVHDASYIVNFFIDKSFACRDWTTAKEFDLANKHREFELLNKYFSYINIF